MKHSQTIGIAACAAVIIVCFLPWVTIESSKLTVTGLEATGTHFGKPGLFNIIMSSVMVVFFLLPKIWAKRTNVFLGAINLAWAIRNYILVSSCMMGECPHKHVWLFVLVGLTVIIQLMTFFPKIELPGKR